MQAATDQLPFWFPVMVVLAFLPPLGPDVVTVAVAVELSGRVHVKRMFSSLFPLIVAMAHKTAPLAKLVVAVVQVLS